MVASKLYYHLGNLDEALAFALGAGKLFDVEQTGDVSSGEAEYVETVICAFIWHCSALSRCPHPQNEADRLPQLRSPSDSQGD